MKLRAILMMRSNPQIGQESSVEYLFLGKGSMFVTNLAECQRRSNP